MASSVTLALSGGNGLKIQAILKKDKSELSSFFRTYNLLLNVNLQQHLLNLHILHETDVHIQFQLRFRM
jgi:hypothetical protein